MDKELLDLMINNPAHLPYYMLLAFFVLLLVAITNAVAKALTRKLSAHLQSRQGLMRLCLSSVQVLAIAVTIYLANSIYWAHNAQDILSATNVADSSFSPWTTDITLAPHQTATITRAWGRYVRIRTTGPATLDADLSTWPSNGLIEVKTEIDIGKHGFTYSTNGLSAFGGWLHMFDGLDLEPMASNTFTIWWRRSKTTPTLEAYKWESP